MRRFLSQSLPGPLAPVTLSAEESRHAALVLRIEHGSEVEVLDGNGESVYAQAEIIQTHPPLVRLHFRRHCPQKTKPTRPRLILEVGILKGQAMEWLIEKAVELGADELVPLICSRSVVDLTRKPLEVFMARWQKIADQALKQCGRLDRLTIQHPVPAEKLSAQPIRFFCDETAQVESSSYTTLNSDLIKRELESKEKKEIHISVGPEGGWTEQERDHLSKTGMRCSLGQYVLRAETASIYALSVISAAVTSRDS